MKIKGAKNKFNNIYVCCWQWELIFGIFTQSALLSRETRLPPPLYVWVVFLKYERVLSAFIEFWLVESILTVSKLFNQKLILQIIFICEGIVSCCRIFFIGLEDLDKLKTFIILAKYVGYISWSHFFLFSTFFTFIQGSGKLIRKKILYKIWSVWEHQLNG